MNGDCLGSPLRNRNDKIPILIQPPRAAGAQHDGRFRHLNDCRACEVLVSSQLRAVIDGSRGKAFHLAPVNIAMASQWLTGLMRLTGETGPGDEAYRSHTRDTDLHTRVFESRALAIECFVPLGERLHQTFGIPSSEGTRRHRHFHTMNLETKLHVSRAMKVHVRIGDAVFSKLRSALRFQVSEDGVNPLWIERGDEQLGFLVDVQEIRGLNTEGGPGGSY